MTIFENLMNAKAQYARLWKIGMETMTGFDEWFTGQCKRYGAEAIINASRMLDPDLFSTTGQYPIMFKN